VCSVISKYNMKCFGVHKIGGLSGEMSRDNESKWFYLVGCMRSIANVHCRSIADGFAVFFERCLQERYSLKFSEHTFKSLMSLTDQ